MFDNRDIGISRAYYRYMGSTKPPGNRKNAAMSASYKVRFEAAIDFTRFQTLARAYRVSMNGVTLVHDKAFGGGEATFTSGGSLVRLRNLLTAVLDGHVMRETIALEADYTGIREYA